VETPFFIAKNISFDCYFTSLKIKRMCASRRREKGENTTKQNESGI
jgi:hypothetical protein